MLIRHYEIVRHYEIELNSGATATVDHYRIRLDDKSTVEAVYYWKQHKSRKGVKNKPKKRIISIDGMIECSKHHHDARALVDRGYDVVKLLHRYEKDGSLDALVNAKILLEFAPKFTEMQREKGMDILDGTYDVFAYSWGCIPPYIAIAIETERILSELKRDSENEKTSDSKVKFGIPPKLKKLFRKKKRSIFNKAFYLSPFFNENYINKELRDAQSALIRVKNSHADFTENIDSSLDKKRKSENSWGRKKILALAASINKYGVSDYRKYYDCSGIESGFMIAGLDTIFDPGLIRSGYISEDLKLMGLKEYPMAEELTHYYTDDGCELLKPSEHSKNVIDIIDDFFMDDKKTSNGINGLFRDYLKIFNMRKYEL